MRSKLCITVWSYHNKCMSHGSCVSTLEGHNGVWDNWEMGLGCAEPRPRHTSTHLDTPTSTLASTPSTHLFLTPCSVGVEAIASTPSTPSTPSTAARQPSTVPRQYSVASTAAHRVGVLFNSTTVQCRYIHTQPFASHSLRPSFRHSCLTLEQCHEARTIMRSSTIPAHADHMPIEFKKRDARTIGFARRKVTKATKQRR